ncbi:MAG: transposase [Cyanobacteria bacterium]|jgi:putative transposase|nr:transposase [Cyanobacteria bacterium GSL.Bin1]
MIVLEFKLKGKKTQYSAIDEAIRTAQFVRNKCLRYWMDHENISRKLLYRYNTQLRKEFPLVKELNSTACQASVERCWSSIARFYDHCQKQLAGQKGSPKFKKNSRSIEYKQSGWKLIDPKHIEFTDQKGIGKLKLIGTWDLGFYSEDQIKRVRLVRRADGYYCQFCLAIEVKETLPATHNTIGLDVGLKEFYTDSKGNTESNPRYYRKSEPKLKKNQRRVSRKVKGSSNRKKAIKRLGRTHLKISRQRKEFAKRLALRVVRSNDLVAYEDLRIKNLVRNNCLSKSINDAGWYEFRKWLEYFGTKYGRITIAVAPNYTSQNCSNCGAVVKKSLSQRTHICQCGCQLDRDHNAALNILNQALSTSGHGGTWIIDPNASGDL